MDPSTDRLDSGIQLDKVSQKTVLSQLRQDINGFLKGLHKDLSLQTLHVDFSEGDLIIDTVETSESTSNIVLSQEFIGKVLKAIEDLAEDLQKKITTLGQQKSQSEEKLSQIQGELSVLGAQLSSIESTFVRLKRRLSKGADIFSHTTTRHEAHEAREEKVSLENRREKASGGEQYIQREVNHYGAQIVEIQAKADELKAIEAVRFFEAMGTLHVSIKTTTEEEMPDNTTPVISSRKWKIAAILGISATLLTGGGFLYKRHLDAARTFAAEKATRLGNYFSPEELTKITPEDVEKYTQLLALIKDANRNQKWNLSDSEITRLVRLGDVLKASIVEPRLRWGNPELSHQIENRWKIIFEKHRHQIVQLCSEKKLPEILAFLRENDDVLACLPSDTQININASSEGVKMELWGKNTKYLDGVLGYEIIPDTLQTLVSTLKSDIEKGTIKMADMGIYSKNGSFLEYLATTLGIDRSTCGVSAFPSQNGKFLEIVFHNIDTARKVPESVNSSCIIDIGTPLRHYAEKNDPDGIEVMERALKIYNFTNQADILIRESVNQMVAEKSGEIGEKLRNIVEQFNNPNHAFPEEFLKRLEGYLHDEISKGPLGSTFGGENITVLCNSTSKDGVGVYVYICRANALFVLNGINITAEGARRGGEYGQAEYRLGQALRQDFLKNTQGDFSHIREIVERGNLSIKPGSPRIIPMFPASAGANFSAILEYGVDFPGSAPGWMVNYIYMPNFGAEIGKSITLPRGLEMKAFFHPLEILTVQETISKIPGLAGNPTTFHHILYEGRKRAVATVSLGEQNVDILLPEAEKASINTDMVDENQAVVKKCIEEARAHFTKHGQIIQLGNELVQNISREFRAKLSDIKVEPSFANNDYRLSIRIRLADNTVYETSIPSSEIAKMIEAHLTTIIEDQKVLSQVDYLVKLNGVSHFRERVQPIGHLSTVQQEIKTPEYALDLAHSGITLSATGEPVLLVVYVIEGLRTQFSFELPAKGRYKN